jgi:hypothetical protein
VRGRGQNSGTTPPPDNPDPTEPDPNTPGQDPKPSDANEPGILERAKAVLCGAVPSGRTVGVNGTLGLTVGGTGSLEQVVNYRTGDISYFASGGLQAGWNGGAQGNIVGGAIYGDLGRGNANYRGWFTGGSASVGLVGAFLQSSGAIASTGVTAGASVNSSQ